MYPLLMLSQPPWFLPLPGLWTRWMSPISVPDLGLLSAMFAVCVVPVCVPIALVPAAPRDLPAHGL